jgi:hypothetical protein
MSVKQNFPTTKPTLNLDFAGSRAVDSRITFNRASAATYTNAQGFVQTVRDNKPRIDFDPTTGECRGLLIEESRTNLLSNSSDILSNSNWSLNGCLTPVKASVVSPNGLMDSYKIMENGLNARHETNFTNFAVTNGVTYVATVYAKAAERSYLELAFGGFPSASFNLTTGATVANGTQVSGFPKMTAIGNGWYKCEFAWLCTSSTSSMSLYMGIEQASGGFVANSGTLGYGLYIWGAQVEAGNFSTSYIPSTQTFVSRSSNGTYFDANGILRTAPTNGARYGYTYDSVSGKWVSQGLLVENASTNLIPGYSDRYSSTFSSEAIWTTIDNSSADVLAPDGSNLTAKGVTGASGNSYWWRYSNASYSANTTYTHSVFIRVASGTGNITLNCYPYGQTVITATTQWQRVSVTFTTDGSATAPYLSVVAPSANTTFYLWGWQVEQGSLTSYIPTYGSATTRSADVITTAATTRAKDSAQLTGINFSSWYNQAESTVYAEADIPGVSTSGSWAGNIYCFGSGGVEAVSAGVNNTTPNVYAGRSAVGGMTLFTATNNTLFKVAQSFNKSTTNHYASGNGSTAQGPSAYGVPYQDSLTIADSPNVSLRTMSGHIKKLTYYPKAVTAAQLQALTV